jgi:hypothetical protein
MLLVAAEGVSVSTCSHTEGAPASIRHSRQVLHTMRHRMRVDRMGMPAGAGDMAQQIQTVRHMALTHVLLHWQGHGANIRLV